MSNVQKETSPNGKLQNDDTILPHETVVSSGNLERKRSSLTIQIDSPKLIHSDSTTLDDRRNLFTNRLTRFIKYKGSYESTLFLPEKYVPEFQGDLVRALGLGSFSVVFKAYDSELECPVAIKKIIDVFSERHRKHLLREIKIMKLLNGHPNVVKLIDMYITGNQNSPNIDKLRFDSSPCNFSTEDEPFYSPSASLFLDFSNDTEDLYIVIEYMKDGTLANFMSTTRILQEQISSNTCRNIMCQIMCGLNHMHNFGIIHRDLKPENLLMDGDRLVLADFGLSTKQQTDKGSSYVCFRYYRPPEIVLQCYQQTTAIDIFSIGCIFFEMLCLEHGYFMHKELFRVNGVLNHLQKFCDILGYPNPDDVKGTENSTKYFSSKINAQDYEGKVSFLDEMCSKFKPEEADLLRKMLTWNPDTRITTQQALEHEYFAGCEFLANYSKIQPQTNPYVEFDLSSDEKSTFKQGFIEEIISFRMCK